MVWAAPEVGLIADADLSDGARLRISRVGPEQAGRLLDVVHAAFAARPPVDPPPAALAETPQSLADALGRGFGLLAEVDDVAVGALVVILDGARAGLSRVAVLPTWRRRGIAAAMVAATLDLLAAQGVSEVELTTRDEFPQIARWWRRHGFEVVGTGEHTQVLRRRLPVPVVVPTAQDMHELGRRLAALLRPGDVIIASGDLGAGKTTLTQGLGAGLDVAGPVISPTFVLSRVHAPRGSRPGLVHVDAYRLGSFDELEDLDLEASLDDAVTVVEWGAGIAEELAADRLEIDIRRSVDAADDTRWVFLTGVGERWRDAGLEGLSR